MGELSERPALGYELIGMDSWWLWSCFPVDFTGDGDQPLEQNENSYQNNCFQTFSSCGDKSPPWRCYSGIKRNKGIPVLSYLEHGPAEARKWLSCHQNGCCGIMQCPLVSRHCLLGRRGLSFCFPKDIFLQLQLKSPDSSFYSCKQATWFSSPDKRGYLGLTICEIMHSKGTSRGKV